MAFIICQNYWFEVIFQDEGPLSSSGDEQNCFIGILKGYFTEGEADETAKLCEMTNDFFDCLNVWSFHEHERKRNALLAPYRSSTDVQFDWLENVFFKYLSDWFSSTQTRPGMYTPEQRAQMFLSTQTYKGLQITIKSVVQVTKFLVGEGCEGALTERFCQDDVEEYFG